MDNLQFITTTRPGDKHSDEFRRQVRSHVAYRQHRLQRRGDHLPRGQGRRKKRELLKEQKLQAEQERQVRLDGVKVKEEDDDEDEDGKDEADEEEDEEEGEEEVIEREGIEYTAESVSSSLLSKTAQNALETAYSLGTIAFQLFALDDLTNTVGTTFNHFKTDASSILKFYESIVRIQRRELHRVAPQSSSITFKGYMSFLFEDPVVLTTATLISLRRFLAPSGDPISSEDEAYILNIKGFLIRKINAALQDERRSISNQMLVCVSLLACYEAKYEAAESSNYHTHMRGLAEMIHMRGGLRAIGSDAPWIERLLVWNDVNTSTIVGCDPYCSRSNLLSSLPIPQANHKIFTTRKLQR